MSSSNPAPRRWWRSAVGYEVYVRSFQDSNGDGVGDLPGMTERLEHLAWLGVDMVWMTPFYPSPMADFGYDVADYTEIDPLFGTLADFDALVERAHDLNLRVIVDLVPNHTSDQHRWFQEALADADGPYRDYYIWRDPAPDGGPPNNWLAHFGGAAWTLDEASGRYYCHLFLPEQPDLNWRNPAVHEEFRRILRFWLERGIDGFRIDVAHSLYKDALFRDNPVRQPIGTTEGGAGWETSSARERFDRLEHLYDLLQPESRDVYRDWRRITSEHDAVLIGETYVRDIRRLAALVPGDGLDIGFWFEPMHIAWDPSQIRRVLEEANRALDHRVGWVQSSHDAARPVSRFGDGELGRRRSLGLMAMMFGLPGTPFLFEGEELGLENAVLDPEELHDPLAVRNDNTPGRDACRTPMPWEPGPNLGFSTAPNTWLPVGHRDEDTVATQRHEPGSHLNRVRELIGVRRSLDGSRDQPVEWLDGQPELVSYRRGDLVWVLNTSGETVTWSPGGSFEVLYRSSARDLDGAATVGPLELGADEATIVRSHP